MSQAERAGAAMDANEYGEAKQLYGELVRQLKAVGLESAVSWWGLAVAHDYLGEHDMALNSIHKALELDPLHPVANRSFDIIVRRVREHLGALPPKDASVPRLYALLQQSGELDVPTHLVMARHYEETGRLEQAEKLLEAVTLLAPASLDALRARARFARNRGDMEAAARFEAEAHARAMDDVPFGIKAGKEA